MENDAKNVVIEFLTAVQQGDTAKLGALLHPEIRWNQPGNNQISGIKKSNKEVFVMVGKMFELSDNSLQLTEIKPITVNGNKVACLLHWNATQSACVMLDMDNIDVYIVENGLITQTDIFTTDVDKENLFWG